MRALCRFSRQKRTRYLASARLFPGMTYRAGGNRRFAEGALDRHRDDGIKARGEMSGGEHRRITARRSAASVKPPKAGAPLRYPCLVFHGEIQQPLFSERVGMLGETSAALCLLF
jgi:hypothetical protein